MKVIEFKENKYNNKKYYTLENGEEIECNEEIIDKLWWQWLTNSTATKEEKDGYVIFKVTEPKIIL